VLFLSGDRELADGAPARSCRRSKGLSRRRSGGGSSRAAVDAVRLGRDPQ